VTTAQPLDPVALAHTLMGIDSTSGREGELCSWMHRILVDRGWLVRRIPVADERYDVLATSGEAPALTFSTHLDTVPPYRPPRLDAQRLWGRGACDAKGIAAAMICAADRLRDRGVPIALLFVVGEETTHDGAHAANAVPNTSRLLINGEPTESRLAVGTKGALRATVRVEGVAAHSAYPERGRSATAVLVDMLHELPRLPFTRDPILGETTVNIGQLEGGVADNVLAPSAEARLMVRIVTDPDDTWRVLERWASGRAALERGPVVPPVHLTTVPGFETSVVSFATDIPALTNWGTPLLFGPGSIQYAHREDEHIELDELRASVGAYERLAEEALRSLGRRE
jgi:acetylornithine deacetylase